MVEKNKTESFEARIDKLEKIVRKLESDIPLDEAIKQYEEGVRLSDDCQKELNQVEKKIMKLVEQDGKPKAIPIEEHEFPTLF
ncbi:MAG: exodeoxyribonuclease VII small subunit [Candidatus Margulisbacteria bacterium GWF2_35_9]|nr:MAG: exodeoxyribonuclease VII small subunit [Candidatus Margulisbacteria bacterium GWF2_35_9]